MKLVIMTGLALLLSAGTALAVEQGPAAGRPGAVIGMEECRDIWQQAGGGAAELHPDQAATFVTNFEQVDANSDGLISAGEFQSGCKAGWVQSATAIPSPQPKSSEPRG
jgi:hypothetical protein